MHMPLAQRLACTCKKTCHVEAATNWLVHCLLPLLLMLAWVPPLPSYQVGASAMSTQSELKSPCAPGSACCLP